jgi:hypothetical protein
LKASQKNWGKKTKTKNISPSAVFVAVGEADLFPESRLPTLGEGTSSTSALSLALGEGPLPRVPTFAIGEPFFIFCFFAPFFCEAFPHYLKLLAQIWLTFKFFCYISLFFLFLQFLGTLQI